ncbi:MAG: MFS transporter [Geminicoccaceae bacterium]|nr:MFS transporter [Geminicoccaceae bacterium]
MTTQATGRGTAGRWAAWLEAASVYLDRRVIAILFLGFSSGLPIMLVATTLSTWLAEEGVSKSTIGLFGFVFVPYTIKFIWAPLIDRMPLPPFTTLLGRRRGWMLFTQLCLVGAIWGLGRTEPGVDLWWTAAMAVTVAFFSASQDVVIDAFRIDSLPKEELGAGAANVVLGYRLAMWVATAGALLAAEWYGWSAAYAAMALLMLVGIGTTLAVREPEPGRGASIAAAAPSSDEPNVERVAPDGLARTLPAAEIERKRGVGGSLLLVVLWLIALEPLSLLFGILSPYHGDWAIAGVLALIGAVALTGFGAWIGLLLHRRDPSAPALAKTLALASLLWLLVELALYGIPAQAGYLGEIYAFGLMTLLWAVVAAVTGLLGYGWAFADVVTPGSVFLVGLWIKLLALVFLYGFFYFSGRAIANFGLVPPEREVRAHLWMRRAVVEPFYDFFARNGVRIAIAILLLISVFKASDAVLTLMANPFYIDVGFSKGQIAIVSKTFGLWMTLLGGVIGGIVLYRLGMMRSMVIAVLVMAGSNLMFAVVAVAGSDGLALTQTALDAGRDLTAAETAARDAVGARILPLFTALIMIENMSGGLGTTVFVAYLSSLCNAHYSAVQYALLTSFMQMFAKFVVVPSSGFYAEAMGWVGFFVTSTFFALPSLLLLWWLSRQGVAARDPALATAPTGSPP